VRETDNVLAYHHTRPFWPAHIVVIPKRHISSLLTLEDTDAPLLLEMISVVQDVARQIVSEQGACRVTHKPGQVSRLETPAFGMCVPVNRSERMSWERRRPRLQHVGS
jgi:hypothetical protein